MLQMPSAGAPDGRRCLNRRLARGSDDAVRLGGLGPVGDVPGRVGRLHPRDAARAERDQQDLVLGLEHLRSAPSAGGASGAGVIQQRKTEYCIRWPAPSSTLAAAAEPGRVVDIVADQPPLGVVHRSTPGLATVQRSRIRANRPGSPLHSFSSSRASSSRARAYDSE